MTLHSAKLLRPTILSLLVAVAASFGSAAQSQAFVAPELGSDAGGNVVYTWQSYRYDREAVIQARRRALDGTLSPTQFLSEWGTRPSRPQIGVSPRGDSVIVYTYHDGTRQVIHARGRSAGGTLGPVQVVSPVGINADQPEVKVEADGDATIIWRNRLDPLNPKVQTRRRAANGSLGPIFDVAPGTKSEEGQLAVRPDGQVTFTWRAWNGADWVIQTRQRAPDGAFGQVQTLSAPGENSSEAQVGLDSEGNAVFVWLRNMGAPTSNLTVQMRRRSTGGVLSTVQTLSSTLSRANSPMIAVDPRGNATAVWEYLVNTEWVVQVRRWVAGASLGGTQTATAPGKSHEDPQVAVDTDGNAVLVWLRVEVPDPAAEKTQGVIQARKLLVRGNLTPIRDISGRNLLAGGQRVIIDQTGPAKGVATLVWQRNAQIQTRRWLLDDTLTPVENLTN